MRNLFLCLLLGGIFLNAAVFAQPELDTTFGGTGKIIQNGATGVGTTDLLLQPDNKVVMVSSCQTEFATNLFCVLRYKEDGSLDTTFGGPSRPGFAFINFPGVSTIQSARGIAVQSDGKLVLAGFGRVSPDDRVIMARLNPDGSLDPSFGSGGRVQTDIEPGKNDRAEKVLVQPDGKIVIIGYIEHSANVYQQVFARYNPDGTLDSSFGESGIVRTLSEVSTGGASIALQTDGKIIAGGSRSGECMVTRLNPDGSPDVTWDGDGISTAHGCSNEPTQGFISIAVQADGRVVALGYLNILYRFDPDGSLDTGFDGDGSRVALAGSSHSRDLTISAGGRITVVGDPTQNSPSDPRFYRLARYLPDGSPDTGFSGDGFLDIAVGGQGVATSVAADSRGRIVVGGDSSSGSFRLFSAARLLAPIVPVTISGRVTRSNGNPASNITVSLGLNGTTIATSRTSPFGYYSFPGVMTGQEYSVVIKARGSLFPRHDLFVADDVMNLDFVDGGSPTKAGETKGLDLEFQDDRKSPR